MAQPLRGLAPSRHNRFAGLWREIIADSELLSFCRRTIPQSVAEELPSRFRYAHMPLAWRVPFAQGS